MDLLENGRIEHVEQFADRLAQQRLAVRRHDGRVLGIGLKIGDVFHHDQARILAAAGRQPHQRRRLGRRRQGAAQLLQQASQRAVAHRSLAGPRLQALQGRLQALAGDGFQQVIDGALVEGIDRVLVVGGDEHHLGGGTRVERASGHFQPRQPRHADIEEGDVGSQGGDGVERRAAVVAGGDDAQCRPLLGQQGHQRVAQQGFVFGDDASHLRLMHTTLPAPCCRAP